MAALAFTLAVTGLGAIAPSAAFAGTGLIFNVVDADNDPYSGLYLRDATNMASANRVQHRYMLYGTEVELICFSEGESVGPHNNRLWHKVYVRNNHAAGQTGWVADRYLNTPIKANERVNGEPDCNASAPPPALPGGGSLYFSPYNGNDILVYYGPFNRLKRWETHPSPASLTLDEKVWQPDCGNASKAVPAANQLPKNKRITTLAGWSSGRNGPIMYLTAKPAGWEQINFVLLIDPGNKDAYYSGRCDTKYPDKSKMLADWLARDRNNTLMVLAGENTADYANKVNGHAHAGIQNKLFQSIRTDSRGVRSQVVVCNYDGVNHENMWINYKNKMNSPSRSCPGSASKSWSP